MKNLPLDIENNSLKVGDRVKVIQVPISILGISEDALDAFLRAIGGIFEILDFDDSGNLELRIDIDDTMHFIYVEPYLVMKV